MVLVTADSHGRIEVKINTDVGLEPRDVALVTDLLADPARFPAQVVQVDVYGVKERDRLVLQDLQRRITERCRELSKEPAFNTG